MKKFLFQTVVQASLLAVFSFALGSAAHATLADDVLGELNAMKSVYHTEYAPAAWKKRYASYDLNTEYVKAVSAVQSKSPISLKDSREILKNFIYAMKDYHTSISFVSTESASLPLTVHGSGDQFFIVFIDRTKLSEESFPFHVGDELVTFGGVPTAQAVAEVQAQIPENVPATDKAIAEMKLTARSAARGLAVPSGAVTLGIKAKNSNTVSNTQLIWEYTPEEINVRGDLQDMSGELSLSTGQRPSLFSPMMSVDLVDAADTAVENPYSLGARRSFMPALGTKIWESDDSNSYDAYIYMNADKKMIGYVRIPGYVVPDYKKAVADFAKIITRFEASTDSMVIDQVNNPGGSVFYMYALLSMLTDQPLMTPLHRMAITQADVAEALQMIKKLQAVKNEDDAKKALPNDELSGMPASYEMVQFTLSFARFFVSEWNAGHKLTSPYWIGGVNHINPAKEHYTKPILLLTNHLDFSGGDFFPTTLQDNKRVTILGSRTAGAGGYVTDTKVPNNIGVDTFRITQSIAERVSGNPIENLGVTPDIVYEMTASDFQANYSPYVKAVQSAISSITK